MHSQPCPSSEALTSAPACVACLTAQVRDLRREVAALREAAPGKASCFDVVTHAGEYVLPTSATQPSKSDVQQQILTELKALRQMFENVTDGGNAMAVEVIDGGGL